MVNVIKIKLNESTVYKYIDTPMMKKVVSYYIIDNDEETQANEWHMTINSEEELRKFAEEQERLLDYDYEEDNTDEVIEKVKIHEYAIKIGNKYFKSFVYSDKNTYGRFTGGATRTGNYETGDIIDIELTKEIELTETRRSLADKIQLIYDIDKFKNKKVSIIPV